MSAEIILLPPARNYIKKIQAKELRSDFKDALEKIRDDYTIGEPKSGNLAGLYGYDVFYKGTNYEISYYVKHEGNNVIIVVMTGTRENFYEELARYWKKAKKQL